LLNSSTTFPNTAASLSTTQLSFPSRVVISFSGISWKGYDAAIQSNASRKSTYVIISSSSA